LLQQPGQPGTLWARIRQGVNGATNQASNIDCGTRDREN
jgi:hypothetical protein